MSSLNDPKKREWAKRRNFAFRLNIFFFAVFIVFSVLIVRLAFLQFVEGSELKELKNTNSEVVNPIPPIRGNIYDVNGYAIAYSTSSQSLYYELPNNPDEDEVIDLAHRLAEVFEQYGDKEKSTKSAAEIVNDMDVGFDINKEEKTILNYSSSPRRLKTDLTKEEIAYILEHKEEFSGVYVREESVRKYSEDTIAVQLTGYLKKFNSASNLTGYLEGKYGNQNIIKEYLDQEYVGFDGLEFMYQETLRGKNGTMTYPVNALGRIIGDPVVQPPIKGNNLYLTIDKDVQLATEEGILKHIEDLRTDPYYTSWNKSGVNATTGYAVAMEVDTGKVIAMASMPDYDPNIWEGGLSQKDYEENKIYFTNGTISTSYSNYEDPVERGKHPSSIVPLGSTIKPLTILIGLNEGLITANTTYSDTGIFYFGNDNSFIRNARSKAFGTINAFSAIENSSNTFMSAMIGEPLSKQGQEGLDLWDSYMKQFGLGVSTESGLPKELTGIIEYTDTQQTGSILSSLIFSSWGQGARYTTLQLGQYATMLANKGRRLQPQFVDKITTYEGETIEEFEPNVLNEVEYSDSYWELVHSAMTQVNKAGFEDFPYVVAAKTGTSQQSVAGKTVENAVFVAFAPAEDPKLAVAIVVPEGGYGSFGAGPIARKIFDAYFGFENENDEEAEAAVAEVEGEENDNNADEDETTEN
ncbi:peptidoglycan D,D-transpeptidase FtsI family protein [Chengkuizengella axinellae]|uniref:Penicillin-binding transpeptidase domain-containing protein n=1 Tax=Chengkuizengella axinellae TaxID=3064388 RepID=A0ABT9ITA3_9BACL|nr:penicillin-binding transpeptidase domain-containing protein [Chengkuizengella sp. 2205SS18-9]MDP5272548.1 penicillin-binding transpeptidase domain-containing protein [Chengkuizengella sp. 2205SS18-9]